MTVRSTIDDQLRRGVELHQAGKLDDAEAAYRSVIAARPKDLNALNFLGAIAHERRQFDIAISFFDRALTLAPTHGPYHYNRAMALEAAGRHEDADKSYRQAIKFQPKQINAWLNLGVLLHAQGKFTAAVAFFRQAITQFPQSAALRLNLGLSLSAMRCLDEAETELRASVKLDPRQASAHYALANVLAEKGHIDDAIIYIRGAIREHPENAEYHSILGHWLAQQGLWHDCFAAHEQAMKLAPQAPKVMINFGASLLVKGDTARARQLFEAALALQPDNIEAHFNLALALEDQGQSERAVHALERVIALQPSHAMAHKALASIYSSIDDRARERRHRELALAHAPADPMIKFSESLFALADGDFTSGWPAYASRFELWNDVRYRHKGFRLRPSPPPYWSGQDLTGKTILVWTEQGIGDEILFSSMIPEIAARAATTILECSDRMVPVFDRSFANLGALVRGHAKGSDSVNKRVDFQIAIGDLGHWLRPNFGSFPRRQQFLEANQERKDELRRRYGSGPLIGISWRSSANRVSERKSFPLDQWGAVLGIRGATFVSLQYGDCRTEIGEVNKKLGIKIIHDDSVDPLTNMDHHFAQVAAMDLVISTSNSTVHVAGALGRQTWVVLPSGPGCHWYWFRDRTDSPWYPSLKLFRQVHFLSQSVATEKHDVIHRIANALKAWLKRPEDS